MNKNLCFASLGLCINSQNTLAVQQAGPLPVSRVLLTVCEGITNGDAGLVNDADATVVTPTQAAGCIISRSTVFADRHRVSFFCFKVVLA
jgi:hypothetical protein